MAASEKVGLRPRRAKPLHALIQPHRQRTSRLQRRVVRFPVRRAVLAPLPVLRFCHAVSLRAPLRQGDLCNKAVAERSLCSGNGGSSIPLAKANYL